jgi:ABC-type bacteriocin/lantibiotic exporter with double-glycine peptidase domain
MKTIIQKEPSGCGFACVAMLAGTSYDEMQKKANSLGIFSEDKKLWSETGYVRLLLKEFKINASTTESPFVIWDKLPELALLAIKYRIENGQPFWHWTVFERKGNVQVVHDPAAYLSVR